IIQILKKYNPDCNQNNIYSLIKKNMMIKIINTSKFTLALFFLFLGITIAQAASNDCLLDVFQVELKEKNSDKLYDYFLNKPEEDCNNAYKAWEVLYKADKNADRFDTAKLDELSFYLDRTDNDIDEVVNQISNFGSFEQFKR